MGGAGEDGGATRSNLGPAFHIISHTCGSFLFCGLFLKTSFNVALGGITGRLRLYHGLGPLGPN